MSSLAKDTAKADPGENVHVIALTGFVLLPFVLHWFVRASRGKDDLSFCPVEGLILLTKSINDIGMALTIVQRPRNLLRIGRRGLKVGRRWDVC